MVLIRPAFGYEAGRICSTAFSRIGECRDPEILIIRITSLLLFSYVGRVLNPTENKLFADCLAG